MNKDFFLWKPAYSVDIVEIDNQHKKIIEMLNELYSAFINKEQNQHIEKIIQQLEEYTIYHFGTEEKYFFLYDYKHRREHLSEHESFKSKIKYFREEFERNNSMQTFTLIKFLKEWLNNHILVEDKKYSQCFKENGLE
jgi:hemerythrin-like metal-binding protein